MQNALLILGMHRSGTSALTRVCNLLGADLGDRLMPAAADNERGFWEQEDVVVLHEALLKQVLANWRDVFPLSEDWLTRPAVSDFQSKLKTLLAELFSQRPLWAVKDPRLSLTLPAWDPVFQTLQVTPLAILMLRHPHEVAQSLLARDKIPLAEGYAIWLHYALMAERHSRGMKRLVVSYLDVLEHTAHTMEAIASRLGFAWPHAYAQKQSEIEAFLSRDLKHHAAGSEIELPPVVGAVYRSLLQSAKTGVIDTQTLDRAYAEWKEKPLFFLSAALREAREVVLQKTKTIEELVGTKETLERTYRDLETQYLAVNERVQSLEQSYRNLEAQYVDTQNRLKTTESDLLSARALAAESAQMIEAMQSSHSWKITKPLRVVSARLKKVASSSG